MEKCWESYSAFDRLGTAVFCVALLLLLGGAFALSSDCSSNVFWVTLNETSGQYLEQCNGLVTEKIGAGIDMGQTDGAYNYSVKFENVGNAEKVYVGIDTVMSNSTGGTAMGWYNGSTTAVTQGLLTHADAAATGWEGVNLILRYSAPNYRLECFVGNATAQTAYTHTTVLSMGTNTLYFMACAVNSTSVQIWLNSTVEVYPITNNQTIGTAGAYNYSIGGAGEHATIWDTVGNVDEIRLYNEALSDDEIENIRDFNQAVVVVPVITDISPNYAVFETTQLFTASVANNATDFEEFWWNFSQGGTLYYSNYSYQNTTIANYMNISGWWNVSVVGNVSGTNYSYVEDIFVVEPPNGSFAINSTTPYFVNDNILFNDTSTYQSGTEGIGWWWDFGDGNTSANVTAGDWNNTYVVPGEYEVCLVVENNYTLNSTEYCDNITINGFAIDVFDEQTYAEVYNWNVTITNSTCTYNATLQNNTWAWDNFTDVCTGSVTIVIEASGYVSRTYYGVYNLGSYINLDAYLLDDISGIYPVFIVRNTQGNVIEGAILTFMKSIGGSWVTVAQSDTDASGTTQVYLDPTTTYYLTVTATGYNPYTTSSFQPVSTTYVITLSQNTTYDFSSSTGVLYMRIDPAEPTLGNATTIYFICNDPWSNVAEFAVTVTNSSGDIVYEGFSNSSASCGILEVDLSAIASNLTLYEGIDVEGRMLRNGINYTIYKHYGVMGSWGAGLARQLGILTDTNTSELGSFNATGNAQITKGTANILAVLVIAAATMGASLAFGWGAGVVGVILGGFMVYFGMLDINLYILASVLAGLVYMSKGVVQ